MLDVIGVTALSTLPCKPPQLHAAIADAKNKARRVSQGRGVVDRNASKKEAARAVRQGHDRCGRTLASVYAGRVNGGRRWIRPRSRLRQRVCIHIEGEATADCNASSATFEARSVNMTGWLGTCAKQSVGCAIYNCRSLKRPALRAIAAASPRDLATNLERIAEM